MLIIGGKGNNVEAAIIVVGRRLIVYSKHAFKEYIPFSVVWLEQFMLGALLILVMIFRPQGLLKNQPKLGE